MEDNQSTLFRKKAMDKISSPDHLTEYLRVTSMGMWIVLAAALVLLVGMLVWASVGSLETKAEVTVVVESSKGQVVSQEGSALATGMKVMIGKEEYVISNIETDEFGRIMADIETALPDGTYEGIIIINSIKPIDFLLERG